MAKYGDPYSEFVLCIQPIQVHTHSSEHIHTVNTHPEQLAAILLWRPGSSWELILKVEESAGYSLKNKNGLIRFRFVGD